MRAQKKGTDDHRLRRRVWLMILAGCLLFWALLFGWLFG